MDTTRLEPSNLRVTPPLGLLMIAIWRLGAVGSAQRAALSEESFAAGRWAGQTSAGQLFARPWSCGEIQRVHQIPSRLYDERPVMHPSWRLRAWAARSAI